MTRLTEKPTRPVLDCGVLLTGWLLRGLLLSLRPVYVERQYERRVLNRRQPFLLAFWHGRSLYFIRPYRQYPFTLLVSHSRDGEFASRVMWRLGIHTTRGSSSHRGARALLQMVRKVRQGYHGAFTPDGPRGPRYQVYPGLVAVAKKTGAPILPVTYNAQWKRVVKSWDRFIIPLPFSRVVVVYGEPIYVPSDASASLFQSKRQEVESSLQRITTMADRYFDPEH